MLLISGMMGINPSLYEAAEIDGANGRQSFFKITVPLLKPILLYTLVTSAVGGLQLYDIPSLFNVNGSSMSGGPDDATTTVAMYIMRLYNQDTGRAAIVFFMKQYMESTLSKELVEAARIDGSGEFHTFNVIAIPLMKPAVATQAIFAFVESWNNLFMPNMIITSDVKKTLPLICTDA